MLLLSSLSLPGAECVINTDCSPNLVCSPSTHDPSVYKCTNPCPSVCGVDAECVVNNHNIMCFCPLGYGGDPFKICSKKPKRKQEDI